MNKIERKLVSWNEVEEAVSKIAIAIKEQHPNIDSLFGIARGGLIPAVMLSHKLNIPLISKIRKNTLVVDDISDSGNTLEGINAPNTAVLFHKPHTSKYTPTMHAEIHTGDQWLIFPWENPSAKMSQDYLEKK